MRITAFFILTGFLQLSATTYSQTISLVGKSLSVERVLSTVREQTGYDVVADLGALQQARPITVQAKQMALKDFLSLVFDNQPLSYLISDRTIFVTPKKQFALLPSLLDSIQAKGRVTDSLGQALPHITIINQRTKKAATTAYDGTFSIAVKTSDLLRFSLMGFEPLTIQYTADNNFQVASPAGQANTLNNQQAHSQLLSNFPGQLKVQLVQAQFSLQEVVVNKGYYTTTQRLNTGAVSQVTGAQIERQPISNPLIAMQGMAPGVLVTQSSGIPGSSVNIQIRGQNSLRSGTRPLYIVDGVPFGNENSGTSGTLGFTMFQNVFDLLNPSDIATIEVLKDADATSIYGSRGANGVVLISTKKGQPGNGNQLQIKMNQGISQLPRKLDLLNTNEYLQMRREAFANDGLTPTEDNAPDLLVWDTTRYTDWQKELAGKSAQYTDAQLQYSGGAKNTQFLLSAGYHHENSTLPANQQGNQRITTMANINQQLGDGKGSISAGVTYTLSHNKLPYTSVNTYSSATQLPPNAPPLYDADGNLNWADGTWTNPLASSYEMYDYQSGNIVSQFVANYYLLPKLYIKLSAGLTILNNDDHYAYPKTSQSPTSTGKASAGFASGLNKNWIAEPQIGYDTRIGEGQLQLLLGGSWQKNTYHNIYTYGYDYNSDDLLWDIGSAGRTTSGGSSFDYAYTAIFGRANYNWKDKYMVNATARRDGSSRFGPGRRFSSFYSVGSAWIFSEENWVKNQLPWLSFGKLRASYGTTGNDQIGNYQYLDTYDASYLEGYEGVPPLVPTNLYNSDYQWESSRKLDLSMEFGFLKDRIRTSATYFLTRSSNQLSSEKLPSQTGFTSITKNQETILQNSGLELEINSTNFKSKNFQWTSGFNLTLPRNKLIAYPGLATSSYNKTYIVGQSYTQKWFGYHYLGVNPETGLYDFQDVNGDGKISSSYDRVQFAKLSWPFYANLNNHLQFKNFGLDFSWYYHKQVYGNAYLSSVPGNMRNQLKSVYENAWRKPGDITDVPRFSADQSSESVTRHILMYNADGGIKDASYLRLRNIALSYDLPQLWLSHIAIKSWQVYANAINVLTFSHYNKADPETQNQNYLPPLRTIVIGTTVTF
ncbi:TonB-linked outer membrane protein, SusC/RagA family [bacterium A37T11]|nr:TonB-linked outer membrane protein, SusC/RagA family [bacterium A37T11]